MITAKEARKRAEDVRNAREREYENKVAELWESWKQDIEKAIEESSAKGELSTVLFHGGSNVDASALEDTLARHIGAAPYSYKFELCWMSRDTYRLKIQW